MRQITADMKEGTLAEAVEREVEADADGWEDADPGSDEGSH